MTFKTEQEGFWAGNFGNDYISRNEGNQLLASNLYFFSNALRQVDKPSSLIEFGANIGMNLRAVQLLFPSINLHGIEINEKAADLLGKTIGNDNVSNQSIFDFPTNNVYDIALIKGVLIHINPQMLHTVYQKLYDSSRKYILICEYYNPSPVTIRYRGHDDRLFKRDFAGEMMEKYTDLVLVDYGFSYKRDNKYPQDDISWFLLQKEK